MQSKAKTVTAYISELSAADRAVVEELDKMVRDTLPDSVASMKFGMPTYEHKGRMLALNAQKNYFSFYADPEFVKKFSSELKHLSCGKSCIRFTKSGNVPLEILERITQEYLK